MNSNAKKIRAIAKEKHVYLWELADHLGVSEATFTRKMRHLSDSEVQELLEAITEIAKESEE